MRRLLLFILPILIIVTLVLIVFGFLQVRSEENKLMDELRSKARSVSESVSPSARYILLNNDMKAAARLVDTFQKRERLQGCALYDKEGKILAVTERFADWKKEDVVYLKSVAETKKSYETLQKYKDSSVYTYLLPVQEDNGDVLGVVEVIYDTSYIFTGLTQLWERLSISLGILIVWIVLIVILVQRHIFTLPVKRLTDWFQRFQKGETDVIRPAIKEGELDKLAAEVEQVALDLRIARKVVSEKASARIQKDEMWTETKLRDLVHAKLGENALFVVSNREPYMHVLDEETGKPQCIVPAGGVVRAINPILRACGGTWIAHGAGNIDRKYVNSKNKLGVPPADNRYILKRVWLTKEEEQGYYYGFANEGLWPLCHITYVRPIFRESDWQMYKQANQKFADSVVEELPARNPFVFIQDYHFTLLPRMIREKRPDATIALFWHIPWPNPEIFAVCPYRQQILDGMLGCDLIGFQVQWHCNNFLDTANRLLESRVDTEKFTVVRSGKETYIRAFPLSIDGQTNAKEASLVEEKVEQIKQEFNLHGKIVGIGVERIDYTKGIKERILAIDRFIEKYPEYKGKFVFIQLAAPSRIHIKSYHDLMAELDELVEKKNWKHSDGDWRPVIYMSRHFSSEEIKPYYKLADLCVVSSLHDGMNLVAKEYVAAKSDLNGVLLLSQFTGAARELTDAVNINPYSIEEFADAIKLAVEMPDDEKQRRMENMRKIVHENNVYRWAANIITELTALKKTQ
jgi:trehalose 6-phosphate synthase